jgi:hypothetical protein
MYSIYNLIVTFIAGLFAGGTLGVVIMAACAINKRSDD